MKWFTIPLSSLSSADVQLIVVNSKKLTLVQHQGNYHVFANKCPHAGGDLTNGWCTEGFLVCPIHRYQYNLENGRGAIGQGDYLRKYPVKIVGENLMVGFKKLWFKFW
ncbi:Rieske (2Fe-2S) protein [Pedobacter arcticus]|uniref:Rieske (2Fe-2S) protein n=1 Tax=Pedobacter arcticus TaxID=752140 RepID=UPI00037C53DB|nr:Rieske (2Fe-2S) protein [Pedobacter arcticus]